MSENIPDWAIERALDLADKVYGEGGGRPSPATIRETPKRWTSLTAFATYIAEHEEAPVDPLLECLRETFGGCAPEFFAAFKAALESRGLKIGGAK